MTIQGIYDATEETTDGHAEGNSPTSISTVRYQ